MILMIRSDRRGTKLVRRCGRQLSYTIFDTGTKPVVHNFRYRYQTSTV